MQAKITAHPRFIRACIDDRLYGAFIEHLGRAVYGGIYEPGHASADDNGFRTDVLELVREIGAPVVRYPGGNFVSAYDWEDGIGPIEQRPTRLDLAWHTRESNEVGIHEFADWCDAANMDMMLAVNLGSRGIDAARNLVEYVNHPGGSYWSDRRIANGRAEPWDVKLWCLGNEMDGPWQIGHKTADEYGHLANETAKALRAFDPSLELVACGSSNAEMPSYPEWEATVLDRCYESVDYISLHMYFTNYADDLIDYLALSEKMDRYIGAVAGVIDYIKAKKRTRHQVAICFDEWNVWYHSTEQDKQVVAGANWPFAPPLLEDIYNFEDALLIGCVLNTLIRRADRVKIACIAQLVNVIAPIMTETGGRAWCQTIFYPYYFAARYGRGAVLDLDVDVPCHDTVHEKQVPALDISGVYNADAGTVAFFAVNRSPDDTLSLDIDMAGFGAASLIEHQILRHTDTKAVNTADRPEEVAPVRGEGISCSRTRVTGPIEPLSYHLIRIEVG